MADQPHGGRAVALPVRAVGPRVRAGRARGEVGRLPLKLSTMPDTVGALYSAPAGVSVAAAIDALKAVTRMEPGAVT